MDHVCGVCTCSGTHFIATPASINTLLCIQASRVTNACQQLQKCGPFIRARPFQYAASPQVDLDSFVLFSHASKLRVMVHKNGRVPRLHFGTHLHMLYAWIYDCVILFVCNLAFFFLPGKVIWYPYLSMDGVLGSSDASICDHCAGKDQCL